MWILAWQHRSVAYVAEISTPLSSDEMLFMCGWVCFHAWMCTRMHGLEVMNSVQGFDREEEGRSHYIYGFTGRQQYDRRSVWPASCTLLLSYSPTATLRQRLCLNNILQCALYLLSLAWSVTGQLPDSPPQGANKQVNLEGIFFVRLT